MYKITANMNFGQIFFNQMGGKYSSKYSFYKMSYCSVNDMHVIFRLTYILLILTRNLHNTVKYFQSVPYTSLLHIKLW